MRNHLDERALHRAWTANRLAGACVSLCFKRIPMAAARQDPDAKRPTMRAPLMARISYLPERSCGFAHRLGSCETDVREQVLLIRQLKERVALGAALGPMLKEPPRGGGWSP